MPLVAVFLYLSTLLQTIPVVLSSAPSLFPPDPWPFETIGRSGSTATASTGWVAPHVETAFYASPAPDAEAVGTAHQWVPLQIVGASEGGRLPVRDPADGRMGWIQGAHVGPIDPALQGSPYLPPIGRRLAWSGSARVTMYTCVELGGCAPTASGIWPEPGVVAVDPSVIPLGSTVWIQGLGTFLAADTGSLVRGAHLDIFSWSYDEALAWGVQERAIFVYEPR